MTLYHLFHCQQGPGPGMESSGIASRLIHWRQGPGPRSGPRSPHRKRPNPDPGPDPDRAVGAPDRDPDPERAIRRPDCAAGAPRSRSRSRSRLRRFLTSFFLRAEPAAPIPLPLLLTSFLQWTVSLSLPGSSRWRW